MLISQHKLSRFRRIQDMTWNEADHPRDEDGKFTFKDGATGLKAVLTRL